MTKRTGGQIFADQLRIQSFDRVFTVPDEYFLPVLGSFSA